MTDSGRVLQAIADAVAEFNQQSSPKQHLETTSNTVLYGEHGNLDSLGLVNLLLLVEEKIEEEFGDPITIADERAMSQTNSPFQSIAALANYVTQLLGEARSDAPTSSTLHVQ